MSPRPEDRTCEPVIVELERFVDGDLPPEETAAVARHLESCAGCRAEARLAEEIRDELRALPRLDAPSHLVETVKVTARREDAARTRRWSVLRPSPVWALAAALLLAAVLTPLWMGPSSTEVLNTEVAGGPIGSPPVDPAEVEKATAEVRVALAYVGQVTRRTGLEIRDGLIVERLVIPTAEGLSSLKGAPGAGVRGEGNET